MKIYSAEDFNLKSERLMKLVEKKKVYVFAVIQFFTFAVSCIELKVRVIIAFQRVVFVK